LTLNAHKVGFDVDSYLYQLSSELSKARTLKQRRIIWYRAVKTYSKFKKRVLSKDFQQDMSDVEKADDSYQKLRAWLKDNEFLCNTRLR
jgi:hypothetical protein